MLKWDMFAGGIGAKDSTHSYQSRGSFGKYDINPPSYGHRGYKLYFVNSKGRLSGGLWQEIGNFASPNAAKGAAKKHYLRHFGKGR